LLSSQFHHLTPPAPYHLFNMMKTFLLSLSYWM
jgi:hypothetical protein